MAIERYNQTHFEEVLRQIHPRFEEVKQKGIFEKMFWCPLKKDRRVYVLVYSTIEYDCLYKQNLARENGADSIKVILWDTVTGKPIGSQKRVNRSPEWETRLRSRIMNLVIDVNLTRCPKCQQGFVVSRYSDKTNNHFWACNRFPACRYTAPTINRQATALAH